MDRVEAKNQASPKQPPRFILQILKLLLIL
jgi:hypothetical protein